MISPELHLVVAIARGGCIGKDGGLPWRFPEDLKHFKALTVGHAIIMGRKTFESVGKPLPGRTSVVVSSRPVAAFPPGVLVEPTLERALARARDIDVAPRLIGGGEIYRTALPTCTHLHVTELDVDVEGGDTFFPVIDPAVFEEKSRTPGATPGVTFVEYARRE